MDETAGTTGPTGPKKDPSLLRQAWRQTMRDVRSDLRRVWRTQSLVVRRAILVGVPVLLVLLLAFVVIPVFSGSSLTGTWVEASRNSAPVAGTPAVVRINGDGTGLYNNTPVKVSYPDSGHISFGEPSGTGLALTTAYHLDGDTLTFGVPPNTDIFHKQTGGFLGIGPAPTPLPTVTATQTPAPTDTPLPTDTAIPTDTPLPTNTPTLPPLPLHIQAHAVPVSTAGSTSSSSVQVRVSGRVGRVALLGGTYSSENNLIVADARTGTVVRVVSLNSGGA